MNDIDTSEFNFKIILIPVVIIGLILVLMPHSPLFPPDKDQMNLTVTPTPTPEIIYIYVTPTPDIYGLIYASEYQNGLRKLNRPFSWYRENVTGNKNLFVSVKVYDYKKFDKIHWFNPTDYKYYVQYPKKDYDYLYIFVYLYIDDIIGDRTRIYLPVQNSYAIQIDNTVYEPSVYPYQLRIRELEQTSNLNDDSYIQAYGQYRAYSTSTEYVKNAGEYSVRQFYLYSGKSNAMDGYIVFEIPKKTDINKIKVLGNFYNFGSAQWVLHE